MLYFQNYGAKMMTRKQLGLFRQMCRSYSKDGKKAKDKYYQQQSVRVAILGADSQTGTMIAFLLKQNPIVSGIFLQGGERIEGITEDLKEFDTRSRVVGYSGQGSYAEASRASDIILLLNSDQIRGTTSARKAFKVEAERITQIAYECSTFAPKAILVCGAYPISLTLPLIRNVYKKGHWYHPGRVMGSVGALQLKAISMVAAQQDLDPMSVDVPIIGGPDLDCMVPLFSRATPVNLTSYEAMVLTKRFRNLPEECDLVKSPLPFKPFTSPIAEAHAFNRMVTAIGLGLCGDAGAIGSAFVRTNVISGCTHCACTVKYGPTGIHHNFGVPRLTDLELNLLEKSILLLQDRENYVLRYMKYMEEEKVIQAEKAKKEKKEEKKPPETHTPKDIKIPFHIEEQDDFPCKVQP